MAGDRDRAAPLGTRFVERWLRRYLNLVGPVVPDHVRGDVSVSLEARPAAVWEYRDFGILMWRAIASSGAVAGQNSFVEFQAPQLADDGAYDLVVVAVRATVAAGVNLAAASSGAGTVYVAPILDSDTSLVSAGTYGARQATFGTHRIGQVAGTAGVQILTTQPNVWEELGAVLRNGTQAWVNVWNPTVNQALQVEARGLLIPSQPALS